MFKNYIEILTTHKNLIQELTIHKVNYMLFHILTNEISTYPQNTSIVSYSGKCGYNKKTVEIEADLHCFFVLKLEIEFYI